MKRSTLVLLSLILSYQMLLSVAYAAPPTIKATLDEKGRISIDIVNPDKVPLYQSYNAALNAHCGSQQATNNAAETQQKLQQLHDLAQLDSEIAKIESIKAEKRLPDQNGVLKSWKDERDRLRTLIDLKTSPTEGLKVAENERDQAITVRDQAAQCVQDGKGVWDVRPAAILPGTEPKVIHHSQVAPFWKSLFEGQNIWFLDNHTVQTMAATPENRANIPSGQVTRDPEKAGTFTFGTRDNWLLGQALNRLMDLKCVFTTADGRGGSMEVTQCEVVTGMKDGDAPLKFLGRADLGSVQFVKLFTGSTLISTFPAQECALFVEGPMTELIPGASRQMVQIGSPDCSGTLQSYSTLVLSEGSDRLEVRVVSEWIDNDSSRIRFLHLPQQLTSGPRVWEVRGGGGNYLGKLALTVSAERLEIETDSQGNPRLSVRYSAAYGDGRADGTYADWHSGESVAGTAVVTRTSGDSELFVTNGPLWKPLPTVLAPPASFLAKPKTRAAQLCSLEDRHTQAELSEHALCEMRSRPWKVTPLTWLTEGNLQLGFGDDIWRKAAQPVGLDSPGQMRFATMAPWKNELVVEVALRDVSASAHDISKDPVEWFAANVTVAKKARIESLPIPLARALVVTCGDDRAVDGSSKGVNGGVVKAGECRLQYSPKLLDPVRNDRRDAARRKVEKIRVVALSASMYQGRRTPHAIEAFERANSQLKRAERAFDEAVDEYDRHFHETDVLVRTKVESQRAQRQEDLQKAVDADRIAYNRLPEDFRAAWDTWQKLENLAAAFEEKLVLVGRQELAVTVSREGTTAKTFLWTLDPVVAQAVAIPGLETKNAVGPYVIEAELNKVKTPAVVWRSAVDEGDDTSDDAAAGTSISTNFKFRAQLRPRTKGALGNSLRMFATIPVDPLGVRFGAKASQMKSSQDLKYAQLASVRTGIAIALEPWNYDVGKSSMWIPMRFEVGTYLFAVQDKVFDPALFGGVKLTLPLLDLPDGQAEDQLGTDATLGFLAEVPLDYPALHFLLTIGVDVFTFLGSK